jgi:chromosome segregation ATPase
LQFTALEEEFRHHRMKQIETGRLKMNLECQSSTLLNKKKTLDDFIKKILPFVDFRLLAWLKENRVEGVHGYLLEHVRIDENVAFAYELSGMQKLGMLLVEDDQVAAKVIEINKKIQGKNVSIMPLNFVKTQVLEKRSYPKMENVYPLINE